MSGVYEGFGLRFLYPENWSITDETSDAGHHSVSVQSPGSAFWTLHVYTPAADPEHLTTEVLRTMQQEYEELDAHPIQDEIDGMAAVGYDMDFYCLDLVVSSQTRGFSIGRRTFLLLCQAENREFEQLKPVFQAMATSLVRSELDR